MRNLIPLFLLGCGGAASQPPCSDGFEPDAAEEFVLIVQAAEGPVVSGAQQAILESDADWDAWAAQVDFAQNLIVQPDFEQVVAFANAWSDGGCEDAPIYRGWTDGDAVRVRVVLGEDGGCDADMPRLDFMQIPRTRGSDFAWCD